MPIKLPNLQATGAVRLIACGRLTEADEAVSHWLAEKRSVSCAYKVGDRRFIASLITGNFKGHFHLECSAVEAAKRDKGESKVSRKEFDSLTDRMIGQEMPVRVKCYFVVEVTALSPTGVIRTLSAETVAAGVSMKLTGGVLSLSGSPIDRIEWQLHTMGKMIRVGLDSYRVRPVTEEYLIELQQWSRSLFDVTVLSTDVKAHG